MLFNSLEFLIFFPITVLIYFLIPKKVRYIWLLISSYYFYMSWDVTYGFLLLFTTLATYLCGLKLDAIRKLDIEEEKKNKDKKIYVAICIGINITVLILFKYLGFICDNVNAVLDLFNSKKSFPSIYMILPVGISFYIFQSIGYVIDVYRGDIYAEKNFCRYALFVSFFPQLVAGPIERSRNLLKQLAKPADFNFEKAKDGFLLMLWGFFLKIVVADRIAIFVDTVYGDYSNYGGWYLIVATVLFAVQIYCDFAGYSIIAMGSAKIMGINLMENFNAPYLAGKVSEFWHRWHISLSSWFKDYLYIPLGGNRKGTARKYINLLIVFLVSGLWHGANWTFIIWGGLNGIFQILEGLAQKRKNKTEKKELITHKIGKILITFLLVDFTWIFFRAANLEGAVNIIKSIFTADNFYVLLNGSLFKCGLDTSNFILMLLGIGIIVFADICKYKGIVIREVIAKQGFWFKCIFVAMVIGLIILFGIWGPGYDAKNFIYFQF